MTLETLFTQDKLFKADLRFRFVFIGPIDDLTIRHLMYHKRTEADFIVHIKNKYE
ncbi:hypothetical protein Pedsa_0839 [Pseudopedobacter saltans DSM 12145]|uniref:Uncharacterized protein n=1 Tax=Pseudopedobacter saltans (strain ATCC 51119 / DSM 12145 / JCM 21818 / CCUG 39354 / LMG 10337 / NBRC 100064 / NCIMB 13643) TaxID=762903 RepID=F0S9Q5_PSESL|nr:hypothetical protein Pedsa_0839 [Pseudopedobacter saltans DSM 12145]